MAHILNKYTITYWPNEQFLFYLSLNGLDYGQYNDGNEAIEALVKAEKEFHESF